MEAQNAALHRDLAAALEHVLHHKLHVQVRCRGLVFVCSVMKGGCKG